MNIMLQVGKANYKLQTIPELNTRASGITQPQWALWAPGPWTWPCACFLLKM